MCYISVNVFCDLRDDVEFAIGRSMSLHISSLWVLLLTVLWPPPCGGQLLDVTLIITDTDGVNPLALPENVTLTLQYDDTLLDVQICPYGTFSDDHSGVCRMCSPCVGDTYVRTVCEPWSDTGCAACQQCLKNEKEICACGVVSGGCYIGDRVCLPVAATTMHLNITLVSPKALTKNQVTFVESGLRTGYVEWLQLTYLEDNVFFDGMIQVGPLTYLAYFTIASIYSQDTVARINSATQADLQRGVLYTFSGGGLRRRRLLGAGRQLMSARAESQLLSAAMESNMLQQAVERQLPGPGRQLLSGPQQLTLPGPGRKLLAVSPVDVGGFTTTCAALDPGSCGTFRLAVQYANCSSECVNLPCPVGYTGDFGTCTLCAVNTYKDVAGNATCTRCPAQHTSGQGSVSVLDCLSTTTRAVAITTSGQAETTPLVAVSTSRAAVTSAVVVTSSTPSPVTTPAPAPPPPPPSSGSSGGGSGGSGGITYDNHVETHNDNHIETTNNNHFETHNNNISISLVDAHQVVHQNVHQINNTVIDSHSEVNSHNTHYEYVDSRKSYDDHSRVEHVSYSLLSEGAVWVLVLGLWALFPLYVYWKIYSGWYAPRHHRHAYRPVPQAEDGSGLRPMRWS